MLSRLLSILFILETLREYTGVIQNYKSLRKGKLIRLKHTIKTENKTLGIVFLMQLSSGEVNENFSSNCGLQLSLKLCYMGEPFQQAGKNTVGLPNSIINETHRVRNDSSREFLQQDFLKKCDSHDVNPLTQHNLLSCTMNPFNSTIKSLNDFKTRKDEKEGWKDFRSHIWQYSRDAMKLSNKEMFEKQQGTPILEQESVPNYTLQDYDRDRKIVSLDHQLSFPGTRCGQRMRQQCEYFDRTIELLKEKNVQNESTKSVNDSVASKGKNIFEESSYYLSNPTKTTKNVPKNIAVEDSFLDWNAVYQLPSSRAYNQHPSTETHLHTSKSWEPLVETSCLDLDYHSDDTAVKKTTGYAPIEDTFASNMWKNHRPCTKIENHLKDETLTPIKIPSHKQTVNDIRQTEFGETKFGRKLIKPSCITCGQLKKVMPVVLHYFENLSVSRKGICRMLKGCLYLNSPKPSPNFLLNTLLPLFHASTVLNFDWTVHSQSSLSYLRLWVCNQPRGKQLIQDFRVHYNAPTGKMSRRSFDGLHVSPHECYVQNLHTVKTIHPSFSFDSVSCVV